MAKNVKFLFALILISILASSSFAFDGLRKGFVLGGGTGVAPTAKLGNDSHTGLSLDFIAGYGWDEKNLIVYENNGALYKEGTGGLGFPINQRISSAVWYHYYGKVGDSFLTFIGFGRYLGDGESYGKAILFGVGYEVSAHWQFKVSYASADLSHFFKENEKHHLNIFLLHGIAF